MLRIILVTKTQGGWWSPIEDVLPPYKAIMFIHNNPFKDRVWDCTLRRWR